MGIEAALNKAWEDLKGSGKDKPLGASFIGADYSVDLERKEVLSSRDGTKVKDYFALLILHYILKQGTASTPSGEWISFRDLDAGEFYYPVFRKRAIEPVLGKYGANPFGIFNNAQKIDAKKIDMADAAVEVKVFEKVPVAVLLWKSDDELPADANILFKENIKQIFGTEDIAVISEIVASKL